MAKTYCAVFPVNRNKSIEHLASTIQTWISSSPHRNVPRADLDKIAQDGFSYQKNHVSVETVRVNEGKRELYATRLIETDDRTVRTTDVASRRGEKEFLVSVTHDYELKKIGGAPAGANKPRIVNDILDELKGGQDGTMLYPKKEPFMLIEDDLEFVAEIIYNQSKNKLPVVYLSRDNQGFPIAHPDRVAHALGGMAHVLVEPTRDFSFKLRNRTSGRNAHSGAVGIYWPTGIRKIILPTETKDMETTLYEAIREQALLGTFPAELRFDGIKSMKTGKQLELLKATTQDEAIQLAIDEVTRREKELKECYAKIDALESLIAQNSLRRPGYENVLRFPPMAELYAGELRDMLIYLLQGQQNYTHKDSRREDLLKAFLELNKPSGQRNHIVETLDSIFKSAPRKITGEIANQLGQLGLAVEHAEGGHVQVYVQGYESRKYTISSTCGDSRGRKNELSGIKNKLL